MKKSQLTAFVLCLAMLASMFTQSVAFAQTGNAADKGQRQIYLHAFDEDETPKDNTSEIRHTVYMGEDVPVFLAVDNPNKGEYLSEAHPDVIAEKEAAEDKAAAKADEEGLTGESRQDYIDYEIAKAVQLARHSESQYDMQGYTVKIYFDTKYFKFKDSSKPFDFKVPNKTNGFEIVDGELIKNEQYELLNPGYMTHMPSYRCDETDREGYAAATVFLMGNGFFPEKTDDLWYNLCKLTLEPLQTGSTSIRLEFDTGSDYDLELFAKNVEDEKLNFDANVLNDGVFYINIEEEGKPLKPVATKPGGTYYDKLDVQLYHTNDEPCEIWYSTNGTDPRDNTKDGVSLYVQNEDITQNEILTFETNTVLKARTYRGGKWSDLASFTYEFLPRAPYLFNSSKTEIPNIYSEIWQEGNTGYYVFTSDNKDFSKGITAGNSIYYTFSESLSPDYISDNENIYVGTDPENQWVLVSGTSQRLDAEIDRSRMVRLVTVNKWGTSDVSVYHLAIKPTVVSATPDSGFDVTQPVTLSCDTAGAKIYYTTNGDDPRRETRFEYTEPLYLTADTLIKAVALYDGQWSDVTSFWYIFSTQSKSGVSAIYPSGIYIGAVEVILYPDEPDGEIEVSFDGGATWQDYDGTIAGDTTTVDSYLEFNARIKSDENTSDDLGDKFVYIIKPVAPVFSPESCDFTSADVVTVFSPESTNYNRDRFELWYSLDGTEPDGSLKAPENDVVNIPVTGYTKIKAVIIKDGEYMSEIVQHTYNVVYDKPAKPVATLPSGIYTREIGSDEFTTKFVVPPKGVEIYYTIGTRDEPFDAPDLTVEGGAIKYDGNPIHIKNGTMIKAVAVKNSGGNIRKSDLAMFDYTIIPEAPILPPSTTVSELPLIPVDTIAPESGEEDRAKVEYKIGNETEGYVTGSFYVDEVDSDGHTRFYIDTETGNVYADASKTELLYDAQKNTPFTGSVTVEVLKVLDDGTSESVVYTYVVDPSFASLVAPFADKESGTYTESKTPFVVSFTSLYEDRDDVSIEWKFDGETQWYKYDEVAPRFETKDKSIYVRTVDESGRVSPSAVYIYTFVPPAPSITPETGIYLKSDELSAVISHAEDIAYGPECYRTYYRISTDPVWSYTRNPAAIYPYTIDKTVTVKAYTYNTETRRTSEVVTRNYIVTGSDTLEAVAIKWPFSQSRISAHLLGQDEYANGIQFIPDTDVCYVYAYTLTGEAGGGTYSSEIILYDDRAAFVPTERIDCMTVAAWINGDKDNTEFTHEIDFVHLDIPKTNLPEQAEYTKNTAYNLVNAYKDDPTVIVYYTTNNSDPTIDSADRKSFTMTELGAEEKLTHTTTVKAVYFSACGEADCDACKAGNYKGCPDYVYGEVGEYKYPVPTITQSYAGGGGSSSGGSTVIDNTREYTKDIFGNEHPTHIGYINGYPDGSVRPEGYITREEITSVLYRITNHQYEKPFVATGDAFPDVEAGRWSAHDIEYMADKEIVHGYPDGEFRPSRSLTRAEFAALIFRFAGLEKADTENPFTDLEETHWAYNEIIALTNSGLIEGYPDKTYKPENNITRAEVMTVVNKLLGRKPLESYVKSLEFNPYNDLYEDKWYYVTVLEATITHNYWLDDTGYEYKWEDWK